MFLLLFLFAFLALLWIEKPVFPPKKGHFCLFACVSRCFSLALFWPPPFHFLFLCLSLVLFFLPSCFSCQFMGFVFCFSFVCFFFQDVLLYLFFFFFFFLLLVLFCWESQNYIFLGFAYCFLVVVFCFLLWYFVIFYFWLPIKNIFQNYGNSKNPQNEECWKKKRTFWREQLALLCSQIVSFFFFFRLCFFKFCMFCWKHYKSRGFSPPPPKKKTKQNSKVKTWSKLKLKIGPSMLRNKIGPVKLKKCFVVIFKKSSSLCRENETFEKKMDQILTFRRAKLDQFLTLQHVCMYVYIYICCEVILWSKLGPFRCYYLVQVGVLIWSTFVIWPIFMVVSSVFWHSRLSFCVCFWCPITCQFKKECAHVFYTFLSFKFTFLFFMFARTLLNIGVSAFLCFCCSKRRKQQKPKW